MGWLRFVGSLKLQVSLAEYRLFYRALLQKRPIILRSLLIVATPYPMCVLRHTHPRTEEIGLQIITTAKISNKFSRESPYTSNMFSRESPKFQTGFHVSKRSPRHSKDLPENRVDLEIQIFEVWSPLWAAPCVYCDIPRMCRCVTPDTPRNDTHGLYTHRLCVQHTRHTDSRDTPICAHIQHMGHTHMCTHSPCASAHGGDHDLL